ncbi:60S ribosomal protein L27 [Acorus calamus]|uniref:60S ribosomal protein L27 n=1 Tax=Acorus calamus TaxID=4465 RepID=A0AAV9CHK8_ACOCL|nr:60S ribosomal protein L27 [Acorus calamus]
MAKKSSVKVFIELINYNHIMPTRYTLDIGLKDVVAQDGQEPAVLHQVEFLSRSGDSEINSTVPAQRGGRGRVEVGFLDVDFVFFWGHVQLVIDTTDKVSFERLKRTISYAYHTSGAHERSGSHGSIYRITSNHSE